MQNNVQLICHSVPIRSGDESGFTLIELMISLVLGLLISAAVVQIYITNVRTSTIQRSGSELQDTSVFGLQFLESHLRLANLGNNDTQINDTTIGGGIVVATSNIVSGSGVNPSYLSRSTDDAITGTVANGWSGTSNINNVGSDQLTIQFNNVTGVDMTDCEGATIANNEAVIERYFLRRATSDNNTLSPGDIKNLVLACDAGRVNATTGVQSFTPATDSRNFGGAGQEFISNIDQFKVFLGVQSVAAGTAGNLQYISSHNYNALTTKPPIVAVKFGVIAHGGTPIVGSDDVSTFVLLGTTNTLKPDASRKKQVRTTYESTAMLRNARIITVVSSTAATALI